MVGSENQPQAGQVSKIATIKSTCLANRTSIDRVGIIQYRVLQKLSKKDNFYQAKRIWVMLIPIPI